MAPDTSSDGGEPDSTAKLLAKCFGVGAALGILGMVVFLALMLGAGITWSVIGLLPAVAAGYGVRRVARDRGGFLTGFVALVTGQGPVVLMYALLFGLFGGASLGRGDVVVLLFGVYFSFKLGMGTDGEQEVADSSGDVVDADGERIDPADVDSEAVAEALEDDADLDDLADVIDQGAAEAEGTPVADAGVGDGATIRDGETASDWVADDGDSEDEGSTIVDDGDTIDEDDVEEPRT